MVAPRSPLPSAFDHGAIRVSRDGALGASRSRLRRCDVAHPARGVATRPEFLASLEGRAIASLSRLGAPAVLSHVTAALILGLPMSGRWEAEPVHLAVAAPARAPRGRSVIGHALRFPPADVQRVMIDVPGGFGSHAVPLLPTPLVMQTLATQLAFSDLVAALDALRYGTRPHGTGDARHHDFGVGAAPERLLQLAPRSDREWHEELERMGLDRIGERGVSRLARAWESSCSGVMSRPETLLRLAINRAGLPDPVVGYTVEHSGWQQRPDLAWPEFAVLAEYEGDHHRTSQRQFRHDVTRFDQYLDAGWSPVRVLSPDLFRNPMPMLARLERRLRRNGWRPSSRWALRGVGAFEL